MNLSINQQSTSWRCLAYVARLSCACVLVFLSGCSSNSSSRTTGLNDTGIDWCSENVSTPGTWMQPVVCSAVQWTASFWGLQQDGYFGRDALASAGSLEKIGSGMAGFDFTRLSYSNTGVQWDCVLDNVTGLMWEVKRNDPTHLRHQEHTYSWYDPDGSTNGGSTGVETGSNCVGVADTTRCNTLSYVQAVNAVGLCGHKDWRIPNIDELQSLVHLGQTTENPTLGFAMRIDTTNFPEGGFPIATIWSSTPNVSQPLGFVWVIDYSTGESALANVLSDNAVRLVRRAYP